MCMEDSSFPTEDTVASVRYAFNTIPNSVKVVGYTDKQIYSQLLKEHSYSLQPYEQASSHATATRY